MGRSSVGSKWLLLLTLSFFALIPQGGITQVENPSDVEADLEEELLEEAEVDATNDQSLVQEEEESEEEPKSSEPEVHIRTEADVQAPIQQSGIKAVETYLNRVLHADLLADQRSINTGYDRKVKIRKANERDLSLIMGYSALLEKPEFQKNENKVYAVDRDFARALVDSIRKHKVVSEYQYAKYNQPGTEIGFCFGRATYAHLMAQKLGVHQDAIIKVWAVGPMEAGSITWQFHVATLVKAKEPKIGWWAVDSFTPSVLSIDQWIAYMKESNPDESLRFYFSKPEKFSVSLYRYSVIQMGLNLTPSKDWYRGYFIDLMKSLAELDEPGAKAKYKKLGLGNYIPPKAKD